MLGGRDQLNITEVVGGEVLIKGQMVVGGTGGGGNGGDQ